MAATFAIAGAFASTLGSAHVSTRSGGVLVSSTATAAMANKVAHPGDLACSTMGAARAQILGVIIAAFQPGGSAECWEDRCTSAAETDESSVEILDEHGLSRGAHQGWCCQGAEVDSGDNA